MKVAIPVKFNRTDSPISPLFGHAKWFAFWDGEKIAIEKNPFNGGMDVVRWLLQGGVDSIITQHIGYKPFLAMQEAGVKLYYPGDGRVLVSDAIEAFKEGRLLAINESNIENFTRHK